MSGDTPPSPGRVRNVLLAGLPDTQASWLARRLAGATVEHADTVAHALAAFREGGWSLLVVDDRLPGGGARELLRSLPAPRPPVFYCVDREAEQALSREGVTELGITRLFYHPLDREELARQAADALGVRAPRPETAAPAPSASLAGAVAGVWERFRDAVLARVDAVEGAALAVLEGRLDEETRRAAEREAHKLAGSVGTFGFLDGSRLARDAETLLAGAAPLGQAEALRLADLAVALRAELTRPPAAPAPEPATTTVDGVAPLLLIVDGDRELAGGLAMEAEGRGLRARAVATVSEARARVAEEAPAAVLLDLSLGNGGEDAGLELLAELAGREPPVPVVVLTARTGFTDRVEVARLGGVGFLQKPVPPSRAVDAVERVLHRGIGDQCSVLAVDDDPHV
ncbi:MAG TPA: response regulator, partial [Longimicrobium sp.]|nr:response regulator [Longimicrobium sp.]